MSKKLIIEIVVILLAITAVGYYGYRRLNEVAYPSCVLSIEEVIRRDFERGKIEGVMVTDEWQTLGEDQEQAIFAEFRSRGLKFDCAQFAHFADGSALLGSKGYIRYRKEDDHVVVRIESDEGYERPY